MSASDNKCKQDDGGHQYQYHQRINQSLFASSKQLLYVHAHKIGATV